MSLTVSISSSSNPACSIDNTMYGNGSGAFTGTINISVSGGTPAYTYQWTRNGIAFSTQQNLQYLQGGTYKVVVTDSLGVTGTNTVTLTNPSTINPHATITPPACSGLNGTIALAPTGGTSPYTYLWSNATTASSLTALAGDYSVVITDSNGCGYTFTYTIPSTPPPTLEIQQTIESGQVILTAQYTCSGGTVLWSTGETTNSIEASVGNIYTVTLSCPSTPCTALASISVPTQEDSYWCCAVTIISDRIADEFNGVEPCDCNDDIILINLIDVYSRFGNGCLTSEQMDAITTKLNEICLCNC